MAAGGPAARPARAARHAPRRPSSPDYYKTLGVARCSSDEIKDAYRTLAKKFHPDKNPNNQEAASQRFAAIGDAYQVLGSGDKRVEYDGALGDPAHAGARGPRAAR